MSANGHGGGEAGEKARTPGTCGNQNPFRLVIILGRAYSFAAGQDFENGLVLADGNSAALAGFEQCCRYIPYWQTYRLVV